MTIFIEMRVWPAPSTLTALAYAEPEIVWSPFLFSRASSLILALRISRSSALIRSLQFGTFLTISSDTLLRAILLPPSQPPLAACFTRCTVWVG